MTSWLLICSRQQQQLQQLTSKWLCSLFIIVIVEVIYVTLMSLSLDDSSNGQK